MMDRIVAVTKLVPEMSREPVSPEAAAEAEPERTELFPPEWDFGPRKPSAFEEEVATWTRDEISAIEAVMYTGVVDGRPEAFDKLWNRMCALNKDAIRSVQHMGNKTCLRMYLDRGIELIAPSLGAQ